MAGLEIVAKDFVEVELGDTNYKMSRMTVGILADLEKKIKDERESRIIKTAKELYGDNVPAAIFEQASAPVSDEEMEQEQGTYSGMLFITLRSLQYYNPSIGIDDVGKHLNIHKMADIIKAISKKPAKKKTVSRKKIRPKK